MGQDGSLPFVIYTESSISTRVKESGPNPTISKLGAVSRDWPVLVHLLPEPLRYGTLFVFLAHSPIILLLSIPVAEARKIQIRIYESCRTISGKFSAKKPIAYFSYPWHRSDQQPGHRAEPVPGVVGCPQSIQVVGSGKLASSALISCQFILGTGTEVNLTL